MEIDLEEIYREYVWTFFEVEIDLEEIYREHVWAILGIL